MPGVLLGLTAEPSAAAPPGGGAEGGAAEGGTAAAGSDTAAPGETIQPAAAGAETKAPGRSSKDGSGAEPKAAGRSSKDGSTPVKEGGVKEGGAEEASAPGSSQVDLILSKLQHCVSRDTVSGGGAGGGVEGRGGGHGRAAAGYTGPSPLPPCIVTLFVPTPPFTTTLPPSLQCDELSVNFCFSNSKGARKRLVRALCDVPKACLQLVPFYARIVATLAPVFPDILQGARTGREREAQGRGWGKGTLELGCV